MTIDEFRRELLEINSQWIGIKKEATTITIEGNHSYKDDFLKDIQKSIEILHAALDSLLLSLKKEQRNDASWLIIQAGKLKREMFKECSEHYKKTYNEEVKSAANLDTLNNNPL